MTEIETVDAQGGTKGAENPRPDAPNVRGLDVQRTTSSVEHAAARRRTSVGGGQPDRALKSQTSDPSEETTQAMESVHEGPAPAAPISHQGISDRPQPDGDWPLEAFATDSEEALEESAPPDTLARASIAGDLAIEYLGVADALARRFRCPGHDPEDLRQVARLGLMKAAKRYRTGRGHGFVPYAVPTITGEIKRYLRDQSWIVRPPRGVQELRLKINAARPRLAQNLGHEPTTLELSHELSVCVEDIAEAQIADASMVPDSIEHGDSPDDPEARRLTVIVATDDPGFEHVESLHALTDALVDASDQDKQLLHLRFVKEMTQEEIAKELGVSQMQVSRLLRRLLGRLRRRMAA